MPPAGGAVASGKTHRSATSRTTTLPQPRRICAAIRALTKHLLCPEGDTRCPCSGHTAIAWGNTMVAYRQLDPEEASLRNGMRQPHTRLSHELFHGLTPEQFDSEARSLAQAEGMTPSVRAR